MQIRATWFVVFLAVGCGQSTPPSIPGRPAAQTAKAAQANALADARRGFQTKLTRQVRGEPAPDAPPAKLFRLAKYDTPAGPLAAYVTPDPGDGKKHPAMVWITGGDCNSIGDGVFKKGPPKNDQSASAFREAGLAMMFPSLRGAHDNPGVKEGFLGEIDDVIAAVKWLKTQPYIDPQRVYLGGHSTGGTTALLAAELSDEFRAVFSFGPVDIVAVYPTEFCPFDTKSVTEVKPRSPGFWLASIKVPTFVIEGGRDGNGECLARMSKGNGNSIVKFLTVRRADHFSVLAPATAAIAKKLLQDTGATCSVTLTEAELAAMK